MCWLLTGTSFKCTYLFHTQTYTHAHILLHISIIQALLLSVLFFF